MKKFYSLVALGALLLVACSENASSISGSTSVPNMRNNLTPQSPVLCSVMGVTDSLEAVENGCIWSPEMWNRTSGYRVRTGLDNGTNTSGIWTWHTEQGYYKSVRFEWPGVATADYDSMALADVIDKCGGSLCGTVVFDPIENQVGSVADYAEPYGSASVEFYFAGKNSLETVDEVDAHAMQGICIDYSGITSVELLPNDSIANLNPFSSYSVELPYLSNSGKTKEECLAWRQFSLSKSVSGNQVSHGSVLVPIEVVATHLKGVRFKFQYTESNMEFDIVNIGWYHSTNVSTTNYHPVNQTCVPVEVKSTFCECDFSEEKAVSYIASTSYVQFMELKTQAENGSVALSNSAEECFESTLDSLMRLREMKIDSPCDNPLPQTFMCADGTVSESLEFAAKNEEYSQIVKPLGDQMTAAIDSLAAHCMSLNN